jgi:hypothetical protein
MFGTKCKAALVSTNSVCQGIAVPPLWNHLLRRGIIINFAYPSFKWKSESTDGAAVHCVIVGFSYVDSKSESRRFKAYYCNEAVPLYAAFHNKTQSFVWRGITPPSEMNSEMELYDTPFTNGRLYIEKNITFFLRRQDPYGDFGLLWGKFGDGKHPKNPMEYFRLEGTMLDLSQIYNFFNNLDNICY